MHNRIGGLPFSGDHLFDVRRGHSSPSPPGFAFFARFFGVRCRGDEGGVVKAEVALEVGGDREALLAGAMGDVAAAIGEDSGCAGGDIEPEVVAIRRKVPLEVRA